MLFRLVTLLIVLMPFGQLTRLPTFNIVSIYLHDVVIGIIALLWLQSRVSVLSKPIVAFVAVGLVSLIFALFALPFYEVALSSLYLVRWGLYATVFFAVLTLTAVQKERLIRLLVASGVVFGLLGLVQYALYPNLRNLYYAGWDPHLNRLFSTFLDPNFAGIYLTLAILLVLSQFDVAKKYIVQNSLALLVLVTSLFLTYSRSSYIAFIAGVTVLGILQKKVKYFVVVIVLFIAILPFLPKNFGEGVRLTRMSTIYSRIENWQEALTVISEHPIFGVGFNTYRYRRPVTPATDTISHAGPGVDNSYLFVLATTGLVGFGAYMWIWLSTAKSTLKSTNVVKSIQLSMFAALFVHAFFVNTLFYPWIMLWMWIALGATERVKSE